MFLSALIFLILSTIALALMEERPLRGAPSSADAPAQTPPTG